LPRGTHCTAEIARNQLACRELEHVPHSRSDLRHVVRIVRLQPIETHKKTDRRLPDFHVDGAPMLLAPQIVPAVSGRFGGFGFGKIIHAGDPRAKRSHGAQTLIGFDLRRIAPAIYARQSAVRSLPQARGARSPRLGSEDTAGRRRLWKGPTSSLERHNPIPTVLPHEIDDTLLVGRAAMMPQVNDVRRHEPSETAIESRRRNPVPANLLRQDSPPVEIITAHSPLLHRGRRLPMLWLLRMECFSRIS